MATQGNETSVQVCIAETPPTSAVKRYQRCALEIAVLVVLTSSNRLTPTTMLVAGSPWSSHRMQYISCRHHLRRRVMQAPSLSLH